MKIYGTHDGRTGVTTITDYAQETDSPYVFNSWLCGFEQAHINNGIPSRTYYRSQGSLVSKILGDRYTRIVVARSPADPLIIRGYAVAGGEDTVHWVNVKSRYRRDGMGLALIRALGDTMTCYTHPREPGAGWLRGMGLIYDDRLFGGKKREHDK